MGDRVEGGDYGSGVVERSGNARSCGAGGEDGSGNEKTHEHERGRDAASEPRGRSLLRMSGSRPVPSCRDRFGHRHPRTDALRTSQCSTSSRSSRSRHNTPSRFRRVRSNGRAKGKRAGTESLQPRGLAPRLFEPGSRDPQSPRIGQATPSRPRADMAARRGKGFPPTAAPPRRTSVIPTSEAGRVARSRPPRPSPRPFRGLPRVRRAQETILGRISGSAEPDRRSSPEWTRCISPGTDGRRG